MNERKEGYGLEVRSRRYLKTRQKTSSEIHLETYLVRLWTPVSDILNAVVRKVLLSGGEMGV